MLVLLCILAVGLCGVLVYGMGGQNLYGTKYVNSASQLVMEKEVSLDGVDRICVTYDMNNNDIRISEAEGDMLTVKEYNTEELAEDEISTVEVDGSRLEVKGKKRNRTNYVYFGTYYDEHMGNYTEIGLPSSYRGELVFLTSSGDISSKMDIAIGKTFKAATSSGDVCIPNITAQDVSIECSSGDVQLDKVSTELGEAAGDIAIKTTSGDIEADQLTGTVNIATSSGEIAVRQMTGDADLRTASGSIESETILGNALVAATSGDVSIQCIEGDVTADSSSGAVQIYEGSGKRTVRTTSGEIVLEQLTDVWEVKASSGAVTIKAQEGSGSICTTSGDIKVDLGRLTGNLTLESSSGLAEIRISEDNAFDFKAATSSGDIDTFFDDELVFSQKRNSAEGAYKTSETGSRIVVRTTSGDVRVINYTGGQKD